jgi:hypothetical protein
MISILLVSQEPLPREFDGHIAYFAAYRKKHNAGYDNGRPTGHLPVIHQETKPAARAHKFSCHNEHPPEPEAASNACDEGRHCGWQNNSSHKLKTFQIEDLPDLDKLYIQMSYSAHKVQIHREENTYSD